jgi:hypothetical protein
MRKYIPNTTILYKFFGACTIMLIIIGIVMEIFDYRSSFIPGPTYESSAISGREVIGVGTGLLLLIFGSYLLKEKGRSRDK